MEITEIKSAFEAHHKAVNERISDVEAKSRELSERVLDIEQNGAAQFQPVEGFDRKRYSLSKAIRYLADPKSGVDAGYEKEIHDEMVSKGFNTTAGGFAIPFEAFRNVRKDATVGGTGSNLVATDHLATGFIDVLRNRSVIAGLVPTVLDGLVGDVSIPKKTASTTGYWFAGDGADSITESDITLSAVSLTPHFLGGLSDFSYKLLKQSTPGIDQIIQQDLVDTLAVALDSAALNGTGTSNQPEGIITNSSINADTYTTAPAWADILNMETLIAADNADVSSMSYLTTPAIAAGLKAKDKGTDTGRFVLEGGQMNGYNTVVTNQMPADTILLGDFSSLLFGIWGKGVEVAVDNSTHFASGSVRVRAIMTADFALRHPESFCKSTVAP